MGPRWESPVLAPVSVGADESETAGWEAWFSGEFGSVDMAITNAKRVCQRHELAAARNPIRRSEAKQCSIRCNQKKANMDASSAGERGRQLTER